MQFVVMLIKTDNPSMLLLETMPIIVSLYITRKNYTLILLSLSVIFLINVESTKLLSFTYILLLMYFNFLFKLNGYNF